MIEANTKKKIVILAWTTRISNEHFNPWVNYWGFGDMIRGMLALYEKSKKHDFELIVDHQLHPLHKYLLAKPHPYEQYVLDHKDQIRFIDQHADFEERLEAAGDILILNSNLHYEHIVEGAREFIKEVLTPNEALARYIEKKNKVLQGKRYIVLHYRLGDECMIHRHQRDFQPHYEHVQRCFDPTRVNVLISDSELFKDYVRSKDFKDVILFDSKAAHVGYEFQDVDFSGTLFEHFMAAGAEEIRTYSIYEWLSGFVRSVHDIYEVPIEQKF